MKNFNNILVFGATSAICHAVLKKLVNSKSRLYLVSRNSSKQQIIADDLQARGATIMHQECYDFSNYDRLESSVAHASSKLGQLDLVIIAHGSLPDQQDLEQDLAATVASINTNYTSFAVAALAATRQLQQQNSGSLAIISSVAGDRGRKSNYVYGASKSAINTLVQGLQGRVAGSPLKIINIKPGMIDTPMTKSFRKGLLWSTPEKIAPLICQAIIKGKNDCYAPAYWRLIMLIIKYLPAAILHRLPI